ncbi:unnamed protein product [Caenorhabditis sp. 36 PRJEB53466]|nr:unnamed protein product [Caenorhabditis sp. 36 PRJEB53466]
MLLSRLLVMKPILVVFFILVSVYTGNVFGDEQLRPAAIIPWSQYQRRIGKVKEGTFAYQKESESLTGADSSQSSATNSFFGSYEKEDLSSRQLPRFDENEPSVRGNAAAQKTRSQYGNVIRPQIRGRLPADPSDFAKFPKTNQVEYLVQRELERETLVPPERPNAVSNRLPARIPLRKEQTPTHQEMNRVPSLAIPNGVPMTAGSWETGQPHYTGDRRLHAANTFAGSPSIPYGNNLIGNELPTAPIYQKIADSNIVSSIFSQSQARPGAIPTMVQTSQPQEYLTKFLTDGASLDQFSKLAKNLLGVGGGNGETGGGSGGLLETMTSVLSGGNRNLPTSSAAHDDLSQYTPSSAGRPQTSVFQKLLNQATDALKDSWKQKETKDNSDPDSKKADIFALPVPVTEKPKKEKLSKDRENSIKLLEAMPEEQRKMLEAAILSGEIDADSPAIKTLVKNDLTEESKKEKENRLIEWIRANRPSKTPENAILKNVPYYGKYLGSLAETPTTKKQKSPAGALWLVDEKRIMVTRFVFESGSLLNENVTFWLGPKTPTGNFVEDFMPSENGFYIKPKPIEMSAFATKELTPIEAKPRPNVAAVKLFEGLPPIVANVSRSKRSADVTEIGATAKPIELFVEGGIMKVLPGNGTETMTSMSSLPDGFRLRQPEFDPVDDSVPQPLQWFEGFQPLMLTLPVSKTFSDIHWVSLRDHKRNTNVASVILPNGPFVQIPKVVRLRALSPNSIAYNISSGPIEVLDVKTIRINKFSFQHDDDSVWLMVGSELFPNIGGKIVPLFVDFAIEMSDYSERPSGSLARIGDYDASSDDSDQNDDDETPVTKKSSEIASIDTDEVAVAEASPAEVGADSATKSEPTPEEPVPATIEKEGTNDKDSEKADDEDSNRTEDNDSSKAEDVEMTEEDNKKKGDVEVKEEDVEDKVEPEVEIKMEDVEMEEESSDTSQKDDDISPSSSDADLVETVVKTEEKEEEVAESSDKGNKKRSSKANEGSSSEESSGGSSSDSEDSDNEEKADAPTGTTKQLEAEEEPNGETETSGEKSKAPENPWETPKQKPVNGIVQPRTSPPRGKPTRHTNCLDFVLFTIVKEALKHKHSWPFQSPVDANKLEIPEYHNVVSKPMDLRTIERRLRNLYYWSADDAIKDINQLFTNCYTFNPPEYDIYKMAKALEKQMLSHMAQMPRSNCKKFNDRNDDIYIMCENVEGVVQRGLEWMPTKESPAELAEHHRRGMFPASTPNGKMKGPKPRGRKSTRGRKKAVVPRGHAIPKEEIVDDIADDASSKVESINFDDDEDDAATEKDVESRAESIQPPEIPEPKPSTSQPVAPKSAKRKAENGDNGVAVKVAAPSAPATPAAPPAQPRKNPNTMIDWKNLPARYHGKQTEWQKFCSKLLTEIHSVRNKGFAQVFYQPVDPIKLKIFDYLDVITNPMDLQTIKKKLDNKQYIEPEEFEADMNLMINNCCTYNPKGSAVHQNALDMKTFFDVRWKMCPRPGADTTLAEGYMTQTLVVNTDLVEDEKINQYINAVKAEEKKCAEKLELLRSMNEGLYGIAMQRREAKLAGSTAPTLGTSHLTQLDKLGITIKPTTPMIVPELISPALSVRSSSRAPVPKIIDDIGPSPIKQRKISKPRPSTASNASVAFTATPGTRGRKPKKSGRPKKTYSPPPSPPPFDPNHRVGPYESIYGRKKVGNQHKIELSERMGKLPHEFITPVLRIIQIGQHNLGKQVTTLRSLCEEEIDFNEVHDDLVIELLDYMDMIQLDKPRAERTKTELDVKAKFFGFEAYDQQIGKIPFKRKVGRKMVRSDSPSPSASRSGTRSSDSDSESDSSDSEPPSRSNSVVRAAPGKRPFSGTSSRASTPAGPSRVSVAAAAAPTNRRTTPPVRLGKDSGSNKPIYSTRTLSESSSSPDSSDSSDSDSEPKKPPAKTVTTEKKTVRKPAPPPPKKKAPLSILDELLPETPEKETDAATSTSGTGSRMAHPPTIQKPQQNVPASRISEEDMQAQREQEHNAALERQAEARRRRALEDQPMIHQHEVMQAFESQYGDFSY